MLGELAVPEVLVAQDLQEALAELEAPDVPVDFQALPVTSTETAASSGA